MKDSLLVHKSLSNLHRPQTSTSGTKAHVAWKSLMYLEVSFSSEVFYQIVIKDNTVLKFKGEV